MALILNGTDNSATTPAVTGTDGDTGLFYPAANTVAVATGGSERMRIDSSGNVGIGLTSPAAKLHTVGQVVGGTSGFTSGMVGFTGLCSYNSSTVAESIDALYLRKGTTDGSAVGIAFACAGGDDYFVGARIKHLRTGGDSQGALVFETKNTSTTNTTTERARITSAGDVVIGKTALNPANAGVQLEIAGTVGSTRSAEIPFFANRLTNDGDLFHFRQDSTTEGTISVSGTTVSYNGGHLSRYAQTLGPKDETLVKGTVLSNLDEMNVYTDADGNPVDNEQLNKVKVSDVEGDANVAGVFVNWSYDEAHSVDEINMAMTGDMIIRIAQGVVVQRGDLLMSAGDGTAKPQGDDIVRAKTIAKVTSTHVTCTYADGSYCVPCVLMAC